MAITTDEFFALAKTEAMGWDMPGLPLVVVPHPLAKRNADECGQFIERVIGELANALTGEPDALAATYREKTVPTRGRRRYRSLFESEFNAPGCAVVVQGTGFHRRVESVVPQPGLDRRAAGAAADAAAGGRRCSGERDPERTGRPRRAPAGPRDLRQDRRPTPSWRAASRHIFRSWSPWCAPCAIPRSI